MPTQTAFVSTETFTQKEFKRWLDERPASDINHYELLRGRIVMSPPAGWPHGSVEMNVAAPLGTFVRTHGLGQVLGSSAGYDLEAIRKITSNKSSSWKFLKVRHDASLWEFRF